MNFDLRPYQFQAKKDTYRHIKLGKKRVINWLTTGAGKGLLMPDYAQDALAKGKKVLVVMRRRDLIFQTKENFLKYRGINASIIMGSEPGFNQENPIQICSIDTIRNKMKLSSFDFLKSFDIVQVDECHDSTSETYQNLFSYLGDKIYIGFTATPFATGGKPLLFWDVVVKTINPSELRDQGFLVPCKIYRPTIIDTTGIKKQSGDYSVSELFNLVNDLKIIGDAIDSYKKYGQEKMFIGFCVNKNHSKIMAKAFTDAGIPAIHIDESHSKTERDNAKKMLLSGKIKGIFNVNIFSTGWDCPPIPVLLGLRPTLSEILALQQWGRVLRTSPETGKDFAIILDHANNSGRHGFPYDDDRIACLTHYANEFKQKQERKEEVKTKDCPDCGLTIEHAAKECWGCGHKFSSNPRDKEVKHEDGELHEANQNEKFIDKTLLKMQKHFEMLLDNEKKFGSKKTAKYFQMHKKFGNDIFSYMEEFKIPKWLEENIKGQSQIKRCANCKHFRFSTLDKYSSRFLDFKSKIKAHDLGYCPKISREVKKQFLCSEFTRIE